MKAELFDFARGRWDFEWKAVEDEPPVLIPEMERGRPPLDRQDMDIIVELQTNAAQSIVEISKQAKLEYYETFRHFRHVMRNKLVEYYRINWLGTGIRVRSNDPKLFSGFHHPHRFFGFTLRFNKLTNAELSHVASGLSKLPFIWSDQGGSGFYYIELNVPLEYYHEALQYVESLVWDLNEKFSFRVLDTTNATSFTIPNQLFDGAAKAWKFDENAALSRLEKIVILAKQ
jgi:hypothetical protein